MAFSCHFHPLANTRVCAHHHDYHKPCPTVESACARTIHLRSRVCDSGSKSPNLALSTSFAIALSFTGVGAAEAAKVGFNKPELLPKPKGVYNSLITVVETKFFCRGKKAGEGAFKVKSYVYDEYKEIVERAARH